MEIIAFLFQCKDTWPRRSLLKFSTPESPGLGLGTKKGQMGTVAVQIESPLFRMNKTWPQLIYMKTTTTTTTGRGAML